MGVLVLFPFACSGKVTGGVPGSMTIGAAGGVGAGGVGAGGVGAGGVGAGGVGAAGLPPATK